MNGLSAATQNHQRVGMPDPAVNPYAIQRHSLVRRSAGLIAGLVLRPLIARILEHEKMRDWVIHYLSNKFAMKDASFRKALPTDLKEIQDFADCYWLFSSNPLNHGLARIRLDEATYLYRLIKSMEGPRVAELGRYKGGTTFLMAAAGAHVISLENGALEDPREYTADLCQALQCFHLDDRAECLIADALTFPLEPNSFDLVFLDFGHEGEVVRAGFELWWPAVKPGRYFIVRDGKCPALWSISDYISRLDIAEFGGRRLPDAPGAFVVFQKNTI